MRGSVCLLARLLVCSVLGAAQGSDCSSINKTQDVVTLTAESWDPALAIARTLADRYGISVSIEAPKWALPSDTEDVAVADPVFSVQHGDVHYRIMKRHVVQVRFSALGNGLPNDVPGLLRQVADTANKEMPYAYRLDVSGNNYALVRMRIRNSKGELEDVQPLLDRHVTIPPGTCSIAEHAKLMADQLGQQTGIACQLLSIVRGRSTLGVGEGRIRSGRQACAGGSEVSHPDRVAGELRGTKPTRRFRPLDRQLRRGRRTLVLHRSRK